jgi:hypothetical protein
MHSKGRATDAIGGRMAQAKGEKLTRTNSIKKKHDTRESERVPHTANGLLIKGRNVLRSRGVLVERIAHFWLRLVSITLLLRRLE